MIGIFNELERYSHGSSVLVLERNWEVLVAGGDGVLDLIQSEDPLSLFQVLEAKERTLVAKLLFLEDLHICCPFDELVSVKEIVLEDTESKAAGTRLAMQGEVKGLLSVVKWNGFKAINESLRDIVYFSDFGASDIGPMRGEVVQVLAFKVA